MEVGMKVPGIIALTGPAGSGKTTAAKLLYLELQSRKRAAKVLGFADPLKDAVGRLMAGPGESLSWDDAMKHQQWYGVPGRRLLQVLGTDVVRAANADAWVDEMAATVGYLSRATHVIISDLRFRNEADWVHSEGGIIVGTVRDGTGLPNGMSNHASEQDPVVVDHWLDNTGDLESTRAAWVKLLGLVTT